MPKSKKLGSGGVKKIGRAARKPTKIKYKAENRRFYNKMKRILQSCGEVAASLYEKGFPCNAKRFKSQRKKIGESK